MSATHNESMRMLARITENAGRHLRGAYRHARVEDVRRELQRETEQDICAAIAEQYQTVRNSRGVQ